MRQSSPSAPSPEKSEELDLELPALDGEDEPEIEVAHEALDLADDGGDALDDKTGEDAPLDEMSFDGAEGGWLVDSESAGGLDVGPFDVAIEPEGKVLEDDEAETHHRGLEDLVGGEEVFVADGGEEGPLADDEELREEDLPALDADDDGDVPDDALYDRGMLGNDELRWDDRAWARAADLAPVTDEPDDSGILALPGDDPAQVARDATWKRLDEGGRVMAAGFVPGGSVVIALATTDRSRAFIVRVQPDGEARIIVEIDPRAVTSANPIAVEDDGEACTVTFLRWDATRGCLFVGGNFGVEAYKPA